MKKLIVLAAYLLFTSTNIRAELCEAVYPSVLQSNSSTGTLQLDPRVKINNAPSTELPFVNGIINSSTGDSCGTAECSVSGASASSLSLPSFPTFSSSITFSGSNTTLGEGSYNTNTFDKITIDGGTTDFSDNYDEYFIKGLTIQNTGILNLKPGIYWVEELKLNSGSNVIQVEGTGTVYLYVRDSFSIGTNTKLGGTTSTAVLNLNAYTDMTLNSNSVSSGLFYVDGDVTINDFATLTGALSSENLLLNSDSSVFYTDSLFSTYDFSETCTMPVSKEPVVEYRFDEVSWRGDSDEVADNSGNGLNGSAVGDTTTISAGQICRAGTFDGTEDYIDVSGIDTYLSTTASLSFWIKTSQSGNNSGWSAPGIAGVEQQSGTNDIFWGFMDASGHIRIHKGNGSSAISSTLIKDDNWHHVVLTRDSSSGAVQVFVDGTLEDSAISGIGDVSTNFSSIGRIEEAYSRLNFIGQLDELLIFDSVISASYVSSIYTHQLNGNNYDGSTRTCPAIPLDHFEIQHDEQGFTCEAETVTIKACADEDCSVLYDQKASITLSPSGWSGGDTLTFTGELTTTLSVTDESTIAMVKTSASPDANLYCFNGDTETCDITFSDDGFEIYGANIGDPLSDQLAASHFLDVNLRAVRSNENVCEALLVGTHEINLSYNCDSPDKCLTPLNGITITNETGENTGNIEVEFDAQGVASLALLNYPDAGRLKLSVQAEVDGVTINNSDLETVDVYPSYLTLSVDETELIYGGSDDEDNYIAGDNFTFIIGAYGVNDKLLLNYQAETPQLLVNKMAPNSVGENGVFQYSGSSTRVSNGLFTDITDIASGSGVEHFQAGEYRFNEAYYSEVGRIELDVKDANYLGNEIEIKTIAGTKDTLILGDFYPAFFKVTENEPELEVTCGVFRYIGDEINFAVNPQLTITAYNAKEQITQNYSESFWNYAPDASKLRDNLTYSDTSYAELTFKDLTNTPDLNNNLSYNGTGTITLDNSSVKYDKVDEGNIAHDPVSPFNVSISLVFASDFFTSVFTNKNGIKDTICFKDDFASASCKSVTIDGIGDGDIQMRYGRLTLESTYGPETESLNVPIKAEYFNTNQWLLNTDDSNCTSIDFTEENDEIQLSDTHFADSFNSVTSAGVLIAGVTVGDQFTLDAPNTKGELNIWLDPMALDVTWPAYLNYDWNGDGLINTDDFPEATVSFGLFRGNDRIIHWREVFN